MVIEFKKHIHYDLDIEGAILGAFMIDKTAFARTHGILTADCFYSNDNRMVFENIFEMWDKGIMIDCLTVVNWMAKKKIEKLDGYNMDYYVVRLTNAVVSSTHLEYHSLLLRQMYAERELVRIKFPGNDFSEDTLSRVKKMQEDLNQLSTLKVSNDWEDMGDVLIKLAKHMEDVRGKDLIGVPTGFDLLDSITGGITKTSLVVLAARPSVGKSAILNAFAIHAATNGYKVGIISLEMPKVQVGARMASLVSDTEFYKIFRNQLEDDRERNKVHNYLSTLADLPIKISDKTGVNINDIKAKTAQLIYKDQLDILFVDYLQLVESEEGNKNYNREQEVSKMSRGLKLMAMDFNIPIVVLAQLNRESEKTATKKPQLHNLRESGAIEQDADGVIFLHRDFKSGITQDEHGNSTERQADLIVAKWRNGETPEVKIGFDPPKMKFYDLSKHQSFNHQTSQQWKPYKEDW